MAQYFGVSQPYVCDWEAGHKTPTMAALARLANLAEAREADVIRRGIEKARLSGRPGVNIAIPLHNVSIAPAVGIPQSEFDRSSDRPQYSGDNLSRIPEPAETGLSASNPSAARQPHEVRNA